MFGVRWSGLDSQITVRSAQGLSLQRTGIKSSKSNFFSVFSFQLSKVMSRDRAVAMADAAMNEQAIGIGGDR